MKIKTDTGIIEIPTENIKTIGHHHGLIYVETTDGGLVVGKGDSIKKIKYYYLVIKWMWKHRTETNNRQKFRRLDREIKL